MITKKDIVVGFIFQLSYNNTKYEVVEIIDNSRITIDYYNVRLKNITINSNSFIFAVSTIVEGIKDGSYIIIHQPNAKLTYKETL